MVKLVSKRRHSVRVTRTKSALRRRGRSNMLHPKELNKILGARTNIKKLYRERGFGTYNDRSPGGSLQTVKQERETYSEPEGDPLRLENEDTKLPEWKEKKIRERRQKKQEILEKHKPVGVKRILLNKEDRKIMEELIARFGDNIHLMSLDSKTNRKLYNTRKLRKLYKLYHLERQNEDNVNEEMQPPQREIRRKMDPCSGRLFRKIPGQYRRDNNPKIETVDVTALLGERSE